MRLAAIGPCLLGFPILLLVLSFFGAPSEFGEKALVILYYTPWVGFPLSYYLVTARTRWGLRYSYQQESMLILAALGNLAIGALWCYLVYQSVLARFHW